MDGACSTHGRDEECITCLIGKPEGEKLLGRPGRKWEDNITVVLREVGWEDVDWIHLTQDRDQWRALVHTVMNL
jgi:hypothetical protein